MPRRDMTTERTEQILDAFERCVVQFGLDGSSLEKIAEEAGMKRTILRHYIGNRDELVHALADRVLQRYRDRIKRLSDDRPSGDPAQHLLTHFFGPQSGETADGVLVMESLIAAAERYPDIGQQFRDYMDELTRATSDLLKAAYPSTAAKARWTVAYGIICIVFNDVSLAPLGLPRKYSTAARTCAEQLMETLAS